MKTTPTFQITDDKRLTHNDAIQAWRDQDARCACGEYGTEKDSVYGTVLVYDAQWLGCPNCKGRALGLPLLYDRI